MAPKPPVGKDSLKPPSRFAPLIEEPSDGISALPQRSLNSSADRNESTRNTDKGPATKRSSSIIKRLKGTGSKDLRSEAPPPKNVKSSPQKQKHERLATLDSAGLSGVNGDLARGSGATHSFLRKPNKLRKKSFDALGDVLATEDGPSRQHSRKNSDRVMGPKTPISPPADSAYSFGESEHGQSGELRQIGSLDDEPVHSPVKSLSIHPIGSPFRVLQSPQPRSASPPLRRLDDHADPGPVAQPAYANASTSTSRPHTPPQRGRFGLFPISRPMTPGATSVKSSAGALERGDGTNQASPLGPGRRERKGSLQWPSGGRASTKGAREGSAPAPGVPRSKRSSSASTRLQKEIVEIYDDQGGQKENRPGRRESVRKKSSLSRLKDWMGRRAASPSPLREVKE